MPLHKWGRAKYNVIGVKCVYLNKRGSLWNRADMSNDLSCKLWQLYAPCLWIAQLMLLLTCMERPQFKKNSEPNFSLPLPAVVVTTHLLKCLWFVSYTLACRGLHHGCPTIAGLNDHNSCAHVLNLLVCYKTQRSTSNWWTGFPKGLDIIVFLYVQVP